jgi:hypothetical protein
MAKQQPKFIFDGEENVTRLNIVFSSAFWPLCNFILHFACSTTCSNAFCVCGLSEEEILVSCHKTLQKSMLPISGFASFVAWVELIFWCSTSQVFLFVYMREHNIFLYMN